MGRAGKYANQQSSRKAKKGACRVCQGKHPLRFCTVFQAMGLEERLRTVALYRYCSNCFSPNHFLNHCDDTYRCNTCRGKHHSMLHGQSEEDIRHSESSRTVESLRELRERSPESRDPRGDGVEGGFLSEGESVIQRRSWNSLREESTGDGGLEIEALAEEDRHRPAEEQPSLPPPCTELVNPSASSVRRNDGASHEAESRRFRPPVHADRRRTGRMDQQSLRPRRPRPRKTVSERRERPRQFRGDARRRIRPTAALMSTQPIVAIKPTAMVKIQHRGQTQIVRALIDSCCSTSLISKKLAWQMRLPQTQMGQGRVCSLSVRGRLPDMEPLHLTANITNRLPDDYPSQTLDARTGRPFAHIQLADPTFFKRGPVDLVIGVDVTSRLMEPGFMTPMGGQLMAQDSRLGWLVSGTALL